MAHDSSMRDTHHHESGHDGAANSNDRSYLSHLVEGMMREMDITAYDNRTCHMLVDLLQREALALLKASAENSDDRLASEREKLLVGSSAAMALERPEMLVTEEDAQLACQEYINDKVIQPGLLRDIMEVQKYANNVRCGARQYAPGSSHKSSGAFRGEDDIGLFPSGQPPYLPENMAVNTLLPHWDVVLKDKKT